MMIVRKRFPYLDDTSAAAFSQADFERYYPEIFQEKVGIALAVTDKKSRQAAKAALLQEVLAWSATATSEVRNAWQVSAHEPIAVLSTILSALDAKGPSLGQLPTQLS